MYKYILHAVTSLVSYNALISYHNMKKGQGNASTLQHLFSGGIHFLKSSVGFVGSY